MAPGAGRNIRMIDGSRRRRAVQIRTQGAQTVAQVVQQFAPEFDPETMEMRPSSTGKYMGLTCTINAISQAQLDDLYRALTSHPMVSVVL